VIRTRPNEKRSSPDFCVDESGNEAVATKKGSYEMQGDAVEMQIGDPNAVCCPCRIFAVKPSA